MWTNTLAGAVLAGAGGLGPEFPVLLLAFTSFYVGGMFLNDAFDAAFDAAHRPERPIPSGEVARWTVFGYGFGLLAAGIGLLAWAGFGLGARTGVWPALAGLALAAAIAYYDWHHKANLFSPVVMGLCRVLVYVGAALSYALAPAPALWIGAALMLCYLIGLTYVAKQETLGRVANLWPLAFLAAPVAWGARLALAEPVAGAFWLLFTLWMLVALWILRRRAKGDIPRAVVSLIAGISLLDAVLIAGAGEPALAAVAILGFLLTLLLQRYIAGT